MPLGYALRLTMYWTKVGPASNVRESFWRRRDTMKSTSKRFAAWLERRAKFAGTLAATLALALPVYAQAGGGSPWENALNVLQTAFTGPIAKGLPLVAIGVGGLTFAFAEGGRQRTSH